MASTETSVRLTDTELVWLTGHCRPEVQAEVNKAKARIEAAKVYDLPHGLAGLVADVVSEARQKGELVYFGERIRHCPFCKKSMGYAKYKSGINRGLSNLNKPLYFNGIEMRNSFVRIRGYVSLGACSDCVQLALPSLKAALVDVRAALPGPLQTEGAQLWARHNNRECTACGWTGHEGEMGKVRALMGGGFYPGICPSCKARNEPMSKQIIVPADGFTVVPIEPSAPTPVPAAAPAPEAATVSDDLY